MLLLVCRVIKRLEKMQRQIETLLQTIKLQYVDFAVRASKGEEMSDYFKESIQTFDDKLEVKEGKKYIKILRDRSVWGFVVNVDNDAKFRKGDILMAAGYNAPARNKARGNILDGGYKIDWTGPAYL